MSTYTELDERLTGRCARQRKLANNTYALRRGSDIAVRLHATDVVTFHPNGDITLNTGGWFTVTTKARMNWLLPYGDWEADYCEATAHAMACPGEYTGNHFHGRHVGPRGRVTSHRGEWLVSWHGQVYPYRDGMVLHADGTVSGAPSPTEQEAERIARAEMLKAIKKFIADITPERIVHQWENSAGDCWLCRAGMTDCLGSHVEEGYFHASLAHNAIKSAKRGNPDHCMQLIYSSALQGQVDQMLTGDLRRYLKKHLIEGVATR